jgi:Nuclease-related domain/AAA domain
MIPDHMPRGAESHGEQRIFEILKTSKATSGWIVLHSLDLPDHVDNICGEVDFVIMVPGYGILCLEVKGHEQIVRKNGLWYFGLDPTPDPRGPFKQASSAAHSFRKTLVKRLPHFSNVPVWSAVSLPFGHLNYNASEWDAWQLLQKKDSSADALPRSITIVLKLGFEKLKQKFHLGTATTVRFNESDAERVAKEFRGDFEILMSPKDRQALRVTELRRFTAEQYFVIDGLREAPRAYIAGPAGTGKTCLAIEAARRESSSSSVLLVCFNSMLATHLQNELAACTKVKVTTIYKLMMDHVNCTHALKNQHDFFEKILPRLFEDAYLSHGESWEQYDILIVDEAQDVVCKHLICALDVSLKDGLSGGHWRMFGDPERQAIYNIVDQIARSSIPGYAASFDIRINCRNTPRVSQYAEVLGGLRPGYAMVRRPDDRIDPIWHTMGMIQSK